MKETINELMIITMEECGELTQACSKVLRTMTKEGDIREDALEKLLKWTVEGYNWMQSGYDILNDLAE